MLNHITEPHWEKNKKRKKLSEKIGEGRNKSKNLNAFEKLTKLHDKSHEYVLGYLIGRFRKNCHTKDKNKPFLLIV